MGIYYTQGIKNSRLRFYDNNINKPLPVEPFEFIKEFSAVETNGIDIEEFKEEHAPYCISGKVKKDKKDTYRRNDNSLIYRDLIFLDYDNITKTSEDFKDTVKKAIGNYSYCFITTASKLITMNLT